MLIDRGAAGAVAILLGLSGCVMPPTAPTIPALSGAGKSAAAFNADEADCRQYAYSQTVPAAVAANNHALGRALLTTALGAAIGGAAAAGSGAAIGAGAGTAFGTAANGVAAGWAQPSLQQHYDALYASCMTGRGNRVSFIVPAGTPPYGGPPPVYGPPPGYYGTPPPYWP
jgi:hypothetical protein